MLKKIAIASSILAVSSTLSFASSAPYLGIGLGLTNNTAGTSNYRGIPFTISGGYGATVDQNVYLAGEIFANLGTATLNNNPGGVSLRTTYSYGLSFIPGLMLSDHAMMFIRLGVIKTRFSSLNSNATTGGQAGLGLQTSVTQNWDVRGEYDYTSYRRVGGASPRSDAFNIGLVYKFE
ncbi:MAG: hypothetical protein ACD_60C00025G0045 [uncultured bacterium]|nr:MAG: hypothetical protein ACD_60C00025G0045 [uncultured bacterium]